MCPQARSTKDAGHPRNEVRQGRSLRWTFQRESEPAHTLIVDFWPPGYIPVVLSHPACHH